MQNRAAADRAWQERRAEGAVRGGNWIWGWPTSGFCKRRWRVCREWALEDAAQSAGAGDVFLIEAPMSAAIGAGLPVSEPEGCMLMDIGAAETEMV